MKEHIVKLEKDLYPIIKKSFNNDGYSVYAEVACNYRGVDMVADNGNEQIAIELKTSFNDHLVRQAYWNTPFFDKCYIAYPVKKPVFFHFDNVYCTLSENAMRRYNWCKQRGIGILQVLPSGLIYEALEAKPQKVLRRLDLTAYEQRDDDVGGVPYQKGVSEGYHELEAIKRYVIEHPKASWRDIYNAVSNHYSSHTSMAGSMSQWRGFSLVEFKKSLNSYKALEEV